LDDNASSGQNEKTAGIGAVRAPAIGGAVYAGRDTAARITTVKVDDSFDADSASVGFDRGRRSGNSADA